MFVIVSLKDQNQGDYSFFAMILIFINKIEDKQGRIHNTATPNRPKIVYRQTNQHRACSRLRLLSLERYHNLHYHNGFVLTGGYYHHLFIK